MLRECMRAWLSAIEDRVAGTSIVPFVPFCLSDGTEILWLYFDGEPLLTMFRRWLKIGVCGLWGSTPKSLSSKAGMLKVSMEGNSSDIKS
jgi:hypothetical protein